MPNWCDNYFEFRIPTANAKPFITFTDAFNSKERPDTGLLNLLYPMPAHQPDTTKPDAFFATGGLGKDEQDKFGNRNWYDWSIKNWGTKWELDLQSLSYETEGDYVYFKGIALSAWSPPVQAFINSGVEFSIYYCETGMNYFGYADVHDDITFDVPIDTDDFDRYIDYRKAFDTWLHTSNLPKDFFDKMDVPAMYGGWEQDDKPHWFDGMDN